jgi:hypothetical protein
VVMGFAIAATVALLSALRPGREASQGDPGGHKLASLLGTLTLVLWVGVTLAGRVRWLALLMLRCCPHPSPPPLAGVGTGGGDAYCLRPVIGRAERGIERAADQGAHGLDPIH